MSCKKQDLSNKPASLQYWEPFKQQSVFYQPIDSSRSVAPTSTTMVQSLIDQANQAFVITIKEWSVAIYYADDSTPRHTVKLTASWAPECALKNVPIPGFAEPDPEKDGSMVVVDTENGCVYDFWKMRYKNGHWKAAWANALTMTSDGIFPKGFSARGSGFELMQGLIWPQELEAGLIEHALIFSYDHTKSGGFVSPATESDGTSDSDWAIPEGALVRLNPLLDLETLGLNDYETTIARALQDYGMYCADDGGGLSLYAVNPISCKENPYASIWGDHRFVFLDKIPVEQFQVMEFGPQHSTEPVLVDNSCAEFH